MNIRITQKQLIIANIILFALSYLFLEYSKMFRMSREKHWIYSSGHSWWITIAVPLTFFGSLILGVYSLWKTKEHKFLYFISSLIPLILLIIFVSL